MSAYAADQRPVEAVTPETQTVLRGEEVTRARTFARTCAVLSTVGLALHMLNPRVPYLHTAAAIGLATLAFAGAFVWVYASRATELPRSLVRTFGFVGLGAIATFQLYCGPFSPVAAILVFGISYFGLGERGKVIVRDITIATAAYVALALAVTFDVIPDFGVFAATFAPRTARLTMTVIVGSICLVTLWQARATRVATSAAIAHAAEAARVAKVCEAQLIEARQDIEALRGAGRGRYSGACLGPWRVGEIIGRGAMGDVYAADHVESGAQAAVKLLNVIAACDPALVERFLREAEIATRLVGPNLARVFGVGEAPDGAPFIVMERLRGRDLAAILRDAPRLPLRDAVELVGDVARGLAVAHAAGIVHRDLKPGNVFLAERGRTTEWTILDFGIAKRVASSGTLTNDQVIGTPGYMAPEQALGDGGDARGDVFSLGAVAYRAITGRAPFPGNAAQALHAVVFEAPPSPRGVAPELPQDVDRVLAIALAKDPSDRFDDATSFADALAAAASGTLPPTVREKADRLLARSPWQTG